MNDCRWQSEPNCDRAAARKEAEVWQYYLYGTGAVTMHSVAYFYINLYTRHVKLMYFFAEDANFLPPSNSTLSRKLADFAVRRVMAPKTVLFARQGAIMMYSPAYFYINLYTRHVKLMYFFAGHLLRRTDSFEKTLIWEILRAGGEGDDRG